MNLYTAYLIRKSGNKKAVYIYIGWAEIPEALLAKFAEEFGMALAVHAKVTPGVASSNDAVKQFWSQETHKNIISVAKSQKNFWAALLHFDIDPNASFEEQPEDVFFDMTGFEMPQLQQDATADSEYQASLTQFEG